MTQNLRGVLDGGASQVFRLQARTSARTIEHLAEAAGWHFLHLDGARVDTKAEFLGAAARALRFPEWAGRNWDAFEELVNDLSWLPPARGYLLLFERASRLAGTQPEALSTALDILETASQNRRKAGVTPLAVVVRGAGRVAAGLPILTVAPPASDTLAGVKA